jgi:hypothetical protein
MKEKEISRVAIDRQATSAPDIHVIDVAKKMSPEIDARRFANPTRHSLRGGLYRNAWLRRDEAASCAKRLQHVLRMIDTESSWLRSR